MDVYWRSQSPSSYFQYEFTVSQQNYDREINIGFFYCRPTPHIIDTIELLSWFIETRGIITTGFTFDQKMFDLAVRGPMKDQQLTFGYGATLINETERKSIQLPFQGYLNWTHIPYNVLQHWKITNLPNATGVHIWSGMGPPHKQIEWARRCFVASGDIPFDWCYRGYPEAFKIK